MTKLEEIAKGMWDIRPWGDEDGERGVPTWEALGEDWKDVYRAMAIAAVRAILTTLVKYHEDKAYELAADMDNDDGHYGAVHAAHIFAAHHFRLLLADTEEGR